jgi:hypothetical protein
MRGAHSRLPFRHGGGGGGPALKFCASVFMIMFWAKTGALVNASTAPHTANCNIGFRTVTDFPLMCPCDLCRHTAHRNVQSNRQHPPQLQ